MSAKEPCIQSKEPCKRCTYKRALYPMKRAFIKVSFIRSNEHSSSVGRSVKEPDIQSKEPHERPIHLVKEPYWRALYPIKRALYSSKKSGVALLAGCRKPQIRSTRIRFDRHVWKYRNPYMFDQKSPIQDKRVEQLFWWQLALVEVM